MTDETAAEGLERVGELLPCPFCGVSPFADVQSGAETKFGQVQFVWCEKCDACGPERYSKAEAIAAWNRRQSIRSKPMGDLAWLNDLADLCAGDVLDEDQALAILKARVELTAAIAVETKPVAWWSYRVKPDAPETSELYDGSDVIVAIIPTKQAIAIVEAVNTLLSASPQPLLDAPRVTEARVLDDPLILGIDPLGILAEFEKWAKRNGSIDLSKTQDAWGRPTYAHSHVDAMWAGWKAAASKWFPADELRVVE